MAKKRYYQGTKDRLAESRGMERSMRKKENYYAPNQRSDGMGFDSDLGDSNMPRGVVEKTFAPLGHLYSQQADDTARGMEDQYNADMRKINKQLNLQKV